MDIRKYETNLKKRGRVKGALLRMDQFNWLNDHNINFSAFVRDCIDQLIANTSVPPEKSQGSDKENNLPGCNPNSPSEPRIKND